MDVEHTGKNGHVSVGYDSTWSKTVDGPCDTVGDFLWHRTYIILPPARARKKERNIYNIHEIQNFEYLIIS
jgi:hypothetical protein